MREFEETYLDTTKLVLTEINKAMYSIDIKTVEKCVHDICKAEAVFFTGVGRVMLSLEAFTKRLTHLGIKAYCVGDIREPAMTRDSILIVASGSGESIVPLAIAKKAKEVHAGKIIHIGSNPNSTMKKYADYMIRIPVRTRLYLEDEMESEQIMTSLFEQTLLILGDVISKIIVDEKKLDLRLLWKYHANLE